MPSNPQSDRQTAERIFREPVTLGQLLRALWKDVDTRPLARSLVADRVPDYLRTAAFNILYESEVV